MPFGLPVVPEVYRMYSGCSESRCSGGTISVPDSSRARCHQMSRPRDDLGARLVEGTMPPDVTPLFHRNLTWIVGPIDHEHGLYTRRGLQGFVHGVLERDLVAAPPAAVSGDGEGRAAIVHAVRDAVGAEAREDDRVRCSN